MNKFKPLRTAFLLLLLGLFWWENLAAQNPPPTATFSQIGCSLPVSTSNFFKMTDNPCNALGQKLNVKKNNMFYELQRTDGVTWTTVASHAVNDKFSHTFRSFGQGTYRVRVTGWWFVGAITSVENPEKPCAGYIRVTLVTPPRLVNQVSDWQFEELSNAGRVTKHVAVRANSNASNVFYVGTDNKMWNVYWDGSSWVDVPLRNDITNVKGPIVCMPGNSSQVIYRGTDNGLHVFTWNGSSWDNSPMNSIQNVSGDGNLAAIAGRIFYKATNGDIWQTYDNSGTWIAIPLGAGNDNAQGHIISILDGEVFYLGNDKRIYLYQWTAASGWNRSTVSPIANVHPSTNFVVDPARIYYRSSSNNEMWTLTRNGSSWTAVSLGGSNNVVGPLTTNPDQAGAVQYRGTDGRLWQFYLDGSTWQNVALRYDLEEGDRPKGAITSRTGRVLYRTPDKGLQSLVWGPCNGTRFAAPEEGEPLDLIEAYALRLDVAPNPVVDHAKINLAVDQPGRYSLSLYDLNGREVHRIFRDDDLHLGLMEFSLDVSGLDTGIYLLRLYSGDRMQVKRVLVR